MKRRIIRFSMPFLKAIPIGIFKLFKNRGGVIRYKLLCIRVLKDIEDDACFSEYSKNAKYKIIFRENKNKFTVFNMCYMSDMLGKALLALALGAVPVFEVLDEEDGENYYQTFFENDKYNSLPELILPANVLRYTMSPDWFITPSEIKAWHKVYKKYFQINHAINKEFLTEWARIKNIAGTKKIIGTVIRGTDYLIKKPQGHPVQPNVTDIIDRMKVIKDTSNVIFYLATDEYKIFEQVCNEMGEENIITSNCAYYDDLYVADNKNIAQFAFKRENDKFLRGFEYFRRVYILSKVDGYIGAMSGAARMAHIMKEGQYEEYILFNEGLY